jgi:hypothetical protein
MPLDIPCPCLKCATKSFLLRHVSPNLARKHLKKHGPAPLAQATNRNQPPLPAQASTSSGPTGNNNSRVTSRSDRISENLDNDHHLDPGNNGLNYVDLPPAHEEPGPAALERLIDPLAPSDTVYVSVEVPQGPEISLPAVVQTLGTIRFGVRPVVRPLIQDVNFSAIDTSSEFLTLLPFFTLMVVLTGLTRFDLLHGVHVAGNYSPAHFTTPQSQLTKPLQLDWKQL